MQIAVGGWTHQANTTIIIRQSAVTTDQQVRRPHHRNHGSGPFKRHPRDLERRIQTHSQHPERVSKNSGRDHKSNAFLFRLASGGVFGGIILGKTNDHGREIGKDALRFHDNHVTVQSFSGFDHTKLTYRYSVCNFRLTWNHG